jgi:hypothetical protein
MFEIILRKYVGHFHALTRNVIFPTVEHTAKAVLFIPAEP